MRFVVLSVVLALASCGGSQKSVVQRTSEARGKTASSGPSKAGDSATAEDRREEAEEDSGRATVDKMPAAVDAEPSVMDPAPAAPREYSDDSPTVAEASDGGVFEGDAWEADEPREEVESLEADIVEAIDDYADAHGVQSHAQRGDASCAEVCDLSRAICKSSGKICTISAAEPGDGWIAGRCTWARTECGKAEERCTICNP